ncbi:MAG: uracil-DNA glycosylase [Azoarcus sp.]|jgi:DNA polymerase|nr:uracil-DNA glycosylase [Azoarcus sp.]
MKPRRAAILREMGLAPLWRLRAAREEDAPAGEENAPVGNVPTPPPVKDARRPVPDARVAGRAAAVAAPVPEAPPSGLALQPAVGERLQRIAVLDWPELEESIRACRACVLCERRTQAVPGVGDREARWMFVGEGPGSEEDRRGEPFVGQAGRLLDNMLAALGLERGEDVYIANAVKCRPPHNRTPEAAEIGACLPFLDRQIALVQPRLLVALGRPAAQALLGREISIAAARGKRFERGGVAVAVTYHPAYLLRNPQDKGKAWEDLCFARALMSAACPEKA